MSRGSRLRASSSLAVGLALFVLLGSTGCVTPGPKAFDESLDVRADAKFEIGEITLAEDPAPGIDEVALMRAALEQEASRRGVLWNGDPAQDHYTLSIAIVEYAPGNAFTRWLAPGLGSTLLHVQGQLVDPRDGAVVGRVDHARSVAFGGGYTIGAWETIFRSMASDVMGDLERRSKRKGFTVVLAPWSAQDVKVPRTARPRTIVVIEPSDERPEHARIGEREAAFGVSMGDVFASRSVPAYLQEAVSDDLRGQGHRVVEEGPGDVLTATVTRFWLHTDTTPLYWDVVAEIELRVAVASETPDLVVDEQAISCRSEDRTYVYPSARLMQKVLLECMGDLMASLRRAMEPRESQ